MKLRIVTNLKERGDHDLLLRQDVNVGCGWSLLSPSDRRMCPEDWCPSEWAYKGHVGDWVLSGILNGNLPIRMWPPVLLWCHQWMVPNPHSPNSPSWQSVRLYNMARTYFLSDQENLELLSTYVRVPMPVTLPWNCNKLEAIHSDRKLSDGMNSDPMRTIR